MLRAGAKIMLMSCSVQTGARGWCKICPHLTVFVPVAAANFVLIWLTFIVGSLSMLGQVGGWLFRLGGGQTSS